MAGFKTIFRTQTTETKFSDVEGLGRLRWEDDRCYRWVINTATNWTPVAGSLVYHSYADGSTALQIVRQCATANLGFLGGVACTTIAPNSATTPTTPSPFCYGWIQCWGPNNQVTVTPVNTQTTANPVSGNALIGVNGADYASTGQAGGTAPIYTRKLLLLDSVAGSTTVQACNVLIQAL